MMIKDFKIKNFRGFSNFNFNNLERINLIFGKKGPKTSRGTMNRMVESDGRKNYHTQTSNEIFNLSGGIFGKKKRK